MIGIRNRLKIVNSKMQPKLADIKETILTIITLALLRLNYCMGPLSTAIAFAKKTAKKKSGGASATGGGDGNGSTFKPDAPEVNSEGTVTLKGNKGNLFERFGAFLTKSHPIIGITITAFGILIILVAVIYAYKGSHDISKGESTGFSSVGYAVGGAIIFGIIAVFAGIAVSMGISTGQNIFA